MGCCQAKQKAGLKKDQVKVLEKEQRKVPPVVAEPKKAEEPEREESFKDTPYGGLEERKAEPPKKKEVVAAPKPAAAQSNSEISNLQDSLVKEQVAEEKHSHLLSPKAANASVLSNKVNGSLLKPKQADLDNSRALSMSQIQVRMAQDDEPAPARRTNIFNKSKSSVQKVKEAESQQLQKQVSTFDSRLVAEKPLILTNSENIIQMIQNSQVQELRQLAQQYKQKQSLYQQDLPFLEGVVTYKDGNLVNLLHLALYQGNLEVVKILVEDFNFFLSLTLPLYTNIAYSQYASRSDPAEALLIVFENGAVAILRYLLNECCQIFRGDVISLLLERLDTIKNTAFINETKQCLIQNEYFNITVSQMTEDFTSQWLLYLLGKMGLEEELIHIKTPENGTEQHYVVTSKSLSKEDQTLIKIINSQLSLISKKPEAQEALLKALLKRDAALLSDPETANLVKYDLTSVLFTQEHFGEQHEDLIGERQFLTPVHLCLLQNDYASLESLLKNTKCNYTTLFCINEGTRLTDNPLICALNYCIQSDNLPLLAQIFDQYIPASYMITEDTLYGIFQILVEKALSEDAVPFLKFLLRSTTTHRLFDSLLYTQKIAFVEQIMATRGAAVQYLVNYVQSTIDEELQQSYFNEKCVNLQNFFLEVYLAFSDQPYSLYFFQSFPEAIMQLQLSEDEQILKTLEATRDSITEAQMELMVWYRPDFSLDIIYNMSKVEEEAGSASEMDRIFMPFILSLKSKCDKQVLESQLKYYREAADEEQ